MHFLATLAIVAVLSCLADALSSSLQHVTSFTSGPTKAGMYVYIPTKKLANAPIIVAIHYCSGSANTYFSSTLYAQYADTYGYIVIYPDSPSSDKCWDVSSLASLTHNGGGDSLTIVNMVKYAISNYGGDSSRVFVTGSSSGAMMTNVLAGAYPDVFKAGTVYSGVPDGCFYVSSATPGMSPTAWNSQCSTGLSVQTAQQWGNLVRSYYPGYTGSYPKLQIYHGTSDFTLDYPNLAEEMKEWSNVFGISWAQNITNSPISGYTKMIYGDGTKLIGYSALNVGHTVPVREVDDLAWFGVTTTTTTTPTTSSTIASTSTPTSTPGSGGVSQHWEQCGGAGWVGPTTCASPYTCQVLNAYYSQCL